MTVYVQHLFNIAAAAKIININLVKIGETATYSSSVVAHIAWVIV